MNALIPQKNSSENSKISPILSSGLNSLLRFGDREAAIRHIANTPVMLAEARTAVADLKIVAVAPAGEDGVRRVIGSRMSLFPPPERSAAESAYWWADYITALSDLTEEALEMGMQDWIKNPDDGFMPKPGALRQRSLGKATRAAEAYLRAMRAVTLADERIGPQRGSRADPEAVRTMMADFRAKSIAKPKASMPERDPILDMDPGEHEAQERRKYAFLDAVVEHAEVIAAHAQLRSNAKAEDVEAVREARVAAYRKMVWTMG